MSDTENNNILDDLDRLGEAEITPEELISQIDELYNAIIDIAPDDKQITRDELEEAVCAIQADAKAEREARAALLASETPEEKVTREVLEGLHHPKRADVISALLDNQRNHDTSMLKAQPEGKATINGPRAIMTNILSEQSVADIYDKMTMFDLVGVQPMAGPVGLLYTLRYRYEEPVIEYADEEKPSTSFMSTYVPLNDEIDVTPKSFAEIPEDSNKRLSLNVISAAIEARTKKLSAGWTVEAMQDLDDLHGIDIVDELRGAISSEIALENDYEILMDLRHLAKYPDGVKANGSKAVQLELTEEDLTNREQIRAKLCITINRECNQIARHTRRGAGNWAVVSPMMLTYLQMSGSLAPPAKEKRSSFHSGIVSGGTLNGTICVYVDPYLDNDDILLGYKGIGPTDAGYFWAPYIPVMSSGVVINPVTFQPVMALMTRSGKHSFKAESGCMGNSSDYYRLIEVTLPGDIEDVSTDGLPSTPLSAGEFKELHDQGKEISDNIKADFQAMFTSNDEGVIITGDSEVEDIGPCCGGTDGRGSRIETLSALNNELSDLEYFQKKIWRGIRIPQSWMEEKANDANYNPPSILKDFFISEEEE